MLEVKIDSYVLFMPYLKQISGMHSEEDGLKFLRDTQMLQTMLGSPTVLKCKVKKDKTTTQEDKNMRTAASFSTWESLKKILSLPLGNKFQLPWSFIQYLL